MLVNSNKCGGLTTSIGVSNFGVEDLRVEEILSVATVTPGMNPVKTICIFTRANLIGYREYARQLEIYGPYEWKSVQPVVELYKTHDIVTFSYSGLSPLFKHWTVLMNCLQRSSNCSR